MGESTYIWRPSVKIESCKKACHAERLAERIELRSEWNSMIRTQGWTPPYKDDDSPTDNLDTLMTGGYNRLERG